MLQSNLIELIYSFHLDKKEEMDVILSISKILNFEQQIVLEEFDAYAASLYHAEQAIIKQRLKDSIGKIASELEGQSTETPQLFMI